MEIIKVEDLVRNYRKSILKENENDVKVLKKISFDVYKGEFVGIMGKSGCGKTTLLKTLGMIDKPNEGKIYFMGEDTSGFCGDKLADIRNKKIGFIFQDFYLMDSLSIEENIMLPMLIGKKKIQGIRKLVSEYAEQFQISHLLNKNPYELSGGEKQRVAICRALINNPDLILADEPTGNLDSKSGKIVIDALNKISLKYHKTIVMVTHDPQMASYCNRIILLKDGKILDKDGNQLYVASAANAATPATFDAKTSTFTTTASFTSTAANTPKIDNAALTVDNLKAIASLSGKTTTVGADTVTVMTDAKNADGTQGTDGIDDTDASIITKENAYKLAANELAAANKIGDTEGASSVTNNNDGTFSIKVGQAKVANALSFSLHVGADADMTNKIEVDIESMDSASLGIKGLNVKDKTGNAATYAIDAIADAVAKVSEQRSALGAVQNRLEHTIANVDNVVENTTSAESRIRDTDMAEEMVNYSKNNILAQAGQSMLAQANQSTQGVLSLLQ